MAGPPEKRSLRALLSGRWQIPLALVAAVMAAVMVSRMSPKPPPPDVAALRLQIDKLLERGARVDALDAAANLLEAQPPLSAEEQSDLHLLAARVLTEMEAQRSRPIPGNVARIIGSLQSAQKLGAAPTAQAQLQLAQASEWSGDMPAALEAYRAAHGLATEPEPRRRAAQAIVRVLGSVTPDAEERRVRLNELIDDDGVGAAYAWWALQQRFDDAARSREFAGFEALLQRAERHFGSADRRGYLEHLRARALLAQGRSAEALPVIEWVDQWLREASTIDREPDATGALPVVNACLLGEARLAAGQLEGALEAYSAAVSEVAPPPWRDTARIGRARALAELNRTPEAAAAFAETLAELAAAPRPETISALRRALRSVSERRVGNGDFDNGVPYLRLLLELAPILPAGERRDALEAVASGFRLAAAAPRAQGLAAERHALAATAFEQAANLAEPGGQQMVEFNWLAAEEYLAAERPSEARQALQRFIELRPDEPRVPAGYMRLGQALEAEGALEEASNAYAQLIERYPALEEAAKASVRWAECLIAQGAPKHAQAEELLRNVMERGQIAPDSPLYRDALLNLGELHLAQQRYGEAIARLGEFDELYPQDANRTRVRYLRADAFRRSAAALRAGDQAGPARAEEGRRRLREAARLFADCAELTGPESEGYARLAAFRAADCLYELNTSEDLRAALEAYRAAAVRHPDARDGLTAYIQIARIHLQLGEPDLARQALRRARGVLAGLPDEAFAGALDGGREAWQRYLTAITASPLLAAGSQ